MQVSTVGFYSRREDNSDRTEQHQSSLSGMLNIDDVSKSLRQLLIE